MKNKTKIMLGLSLLTAGTLAAGATGTFAWFTTNKSAKATYSNIVAVATQGDLQAKIAGVTDATPSDVSDFNKEAKATGSKAFISDVSSNDGLSFAQPDWVSESGNGKAYNKIDDVSKKAGYYTQYLVTLRNNKASNNESAVSNSIKVSLSGLKVTVSPASDSASTTAGDANWIRVAIFSGDTADIAAENGFLNTTNSTLKGVYSNKVNDSNNKYVASSTESGDNLTLLESSVQSTSNLSTKKVALVSKLVAGGETRTIGVSVWLEGTAADNQDNMKNAKVTVELEFTAETVS